MPQEPASDESLLEALEHATPEERRRLASDLFSRHYVRVARWCYRLTGDRDAAADLAQDVFTKAYRHLDSFRGASRFSTWLYSIARNEALTWGQRQAARPRVEAEDALEALPSRGEGPDEALERERRHHHVHRFLGETLSEMERTVFTLHYGDQMTLDDISRLLQLTNTSGAKAFIVSARRKVTRAVERLKARGGVL